MTVNKADRGGPDRAKGTLPTLPVVPVFGPGGWRERNGHVFSSDPQLRWVIHDRHDELIKAGALARFRNRLYGVEPVFSRMILEIGRRAYCGQQDALAEAREADIEAVTAMVLATEGRADVDEQTAAAIEANLTR